jgi:ATP-binding cassette subfamily B protein
VSIDGIDLRRLDEAGIAGIVGVVSQETYLVHDTIRANLLLARPEATEAQLWQALAAAQVADLVAGLPDGLATVGSQR